MPIAHAVLTQLSQHQTSVCPAAEPTEAGPSTTSEADQQATDNYRQQSSYPRETSVFGDFGTSTKHAQTAAI